MVVRWWFRSGLPYGFATLPAIVIDVREILADSHERLQVGGL